MKPSKYLNKIRNKTLNYLYKLHNMADKASRLSRPESEKTISFVTIECLNLWANFSRAYFLSCALSPIRENGLQITLSNPNVQTFDDAIYAALRKCKPWILSMRNWGRRDEPAWHDPKVLIKSCTGIGCSNLIEIQAAFSISTKVFEHLSTFRNFYAHRNYYTAQKAKNIARYYTILVHNHPSNILFSYAYGRPQILILDWIDDMKIVLELLCK